MKEKMKNAWNSTKAFMKRHSTKLEIGAVCAILLALLFRGKKEDAATE